MSVKSSQADRSEATRALLVGTAERLFTARGYAGTATEDIVAAAGVTRGALYHHFKDKKDLFRAVFVAIEERMVANLAGLAMGADDAWTVVIAGVRGFLDACLEPAVQRIALIEAPAVLGWNEWREIDERYALGLVRMSLETAMEAGEIERQPLDPLAHVLLGALTEAALLIARAADTEAARRTVGDTVERLISSLRVPQAATK